MRKRARTPRTAIATLPAYLPNAFVAVEDQRFYAHKGVDVVGIATDYCVRASALDAIAAGRRVRVLTDLVAGVAPDSSDRALAEIAHAGGALAASHVGARSGGRVGRIRRAGRRDLPVRDGGAPAG